MNLSSIAANITRATTPAANRTPAQAQPQVVDQFTPSEFGQAHSQLLQALLAPVAEKVGAKSLTDKLAIGVLDQRQVQPEVGLIYDNLGELASAKKGAIPLKDLYTIDAQMVEQIVAQATKTTGGLLTPESARFLPQNLQAEYRELSGQKPDSKPGIAVEGITIEEGPSSLNVDIEFEKALQGASTKDIVLAVTEKLVIHADRIDGGVEDASIPPYRMIISPRAGGMDPGAQLSHQGVRQFTDPSLGNLIFAGEHSLSLIDGESKPIQTMEFSLDKVNTYGAAGVEPSEKTRAAREAWDAFFVEGGFDFSEGLKNGSLQSRTYEEAKAQKGTKILFSAIRDLGVGSLTRLVKNGLLEFAYHKESDTLAVCRRNEEALEHTLSVVDCAKGKWVGSWLASDDGSKEWRER